MAVSGHQVQEVEIVSGAAEVNAAQDGARGRQGRSEEILLLREVESRCREKGEEVGALKGVCGVLPHNYTKMVSFEGRTGRSDLEGRSYYRSRRDQTLPPSHEPSAQSCLSVLRCLLRAGRWRLTDSPQLTK